MTNVIRAEGEADAAKKISEALKFGTPSIYKTVKPRYKTGISIYKIVKPSYKTVKSSHKTVKST